MKRLLLTLLLLPPFLRAERYFIFHVGSYDALKSIPVQLSMESLKNTGATIVWTERQTVMYALVGVTSIVASYFAYKWYRHKTRRRLCAECLCWVSICDASKEEILIDQEHCAFCSKRN